MALRIDKMSEDEKAALRVLTASNKKTIDAIEVFVPHIKSVIKEITRHEVIIPRETLHKEMEEQHDNEILKIKGIPEELGRIDRLTPYYRGCVSKLSSQESFVLDLFSPSLNPVTKDDIALRSRKNITFDNTRMEKLCKKAPQLISFQDNAIRIIDPDFFLFIVLNSTEFLQHFKNLPRPHSATCISEFIENSKG